VPPPAWAVDVGRARLLTWPLHHNANYVSGSRLGVLRRRPAAADDEVGPACRRLAALRASRGHIDVGGVRVSGFRCCMRRRPRRASASAWCAAVVVPPPRPPAVLCRPRPGEIMHGAVGPTATQLACQAGARVIGTGRAGGRQTASAPASSSTSTTTHRNVGEVDLVFDVLRPRHPAAVRGSGQREERW
jgi:hypothetical protein